MLLTDYGAQYRAGSATQMVMVTLQKICLSHLVLSLAKFIEFRERFTESPHSSIAML